MNGRFLFAPHFAGVIKCETDYTFRGLYRNRLYSYAGICGYLSAAVFIQPVYKLDGVVFAFLKFYPRVKVFGVFPHDYKVDIGVSASHAFIAFARPKARVQIKRLTQMNVYTSKPFSDRRSYRRLQRNAVS